MKFVKTGLVLEGGAMRGLFTAGVIDVLMENNIKFDGAVGVSAGAAFGVNYKSHQIGRVLRYNLKFAGDPRFASWKSWRKSGNLYGANFCYPLIPDKLDKFDKETFAKDPMEFWCVATNAETGKAVYHKLTMQGISTWNGLEHRLRFHFLRMLLQLEEIIILTVVFLIQFR